jgi:hypothetical protein
VMNASIDAMPRSAEVAMPEIEIACNLLRGPDGGRVGGSSVPSGTRSPLGSSRPRSPGVSALFPSPS